MSRRFRVRERVLVAIGVASMALFVPTVASQSSVQTREPGWVTFLRAEREFRDRNLGRALQLYGEALQAQPVFPEAELGIARVYRAEGAVDLAERFYRQAIDRADALDVPESEYAIRLELAELLTDLGRSDEARVELEAIVARDAIFAQRNPAWQRSAMRELLRDRGLDRVLVLYRVDFPPALAAHRELARYYLGPGNDTERALDHALFAVVQIVGRTVEVLLTREIGFQFSTVESFIATAARHEDIAAHLRRIDLAGALRTLAEALERDGEPEESARIASLDLSALGSR